VDPGALKFLVNRKLYPYRESSLGYPAGYHQASSLYFRDPIRHGFLGTILLWVLKNFVPVSRKIRCGSPNAPSPFSKLSKRDISANVCEHFDFRTFVENIYNRGTATDREREEDVWIGDCRVLSETAKGVWREISK